MRPDTKTASKALIGLLRLATDYISPVTPDVSLHGRCGCAKYNMDIHTKVKS